MLSVYTIQGIFSSQKNRFFSHKTTIKKPPGNAKKRIYDFEQRSKAARPVLLFKIIYPFFG